MIGRNGNRNKTRVPFESLVSIHQMRFVLLVPAMENRQVDEENGRYAVNILVQIWKC